MTLPTDPPAASVPAAAVISDRRRELRVKIKSLAQEARIIRQEERRCLDSIARTVVYNAEKNAMVPVPEWQAPLRGSYTSLHLHRVGDVRREARYSLLAYAMIRGKLFRKTEAKSDVSKIDIAKLADLVGRFGPFNLVKPVMEGAVKLWLTKL